jgi:uncharacterized protein YfaS (alpha-2-macroglobulin family)
MAPPGKMSPAAGSGGLDPIAAIDLFFPTALGAEKLAAMISFTVKPLPGLGEKGYSLTARDFTVKEYEQPGLNKPVQYCVTFNKPVGFGCQLAMSLRLAAESRFPGTLQQYFFSTRPNFKLTGIGSGGTIFPVAAKGSVYSLDQALDCGTEAAPLFLEFSDKPALLTLNEVKQMARFEPAVRDLSFELAGDRIILNFRAAPDKAYRLRLQYLPLKNISGDVLQSLGPTELYFYFRQAQPYVKWLTAQGIVERFGPQMLPLEGRSLEKADVRIYKIDPLARSFWPFPDEAVIVNEDSRPASPGEEPGLLERSRSYGRQESYEESEGDEEDSGNVEEDAESGYSNRNRYGDDYAANMAEHIKLAGSPLVSKIMALPLKNNGRKMRFGLDLKNELTRISGADVPGTYLVGYRQIGLGDQRRYVRLQVTDLDLSVVEEETAATFVVTSLKSGQPIANAEVWVEGEYSGAWHKVVKGTTDANGRFRYVHRSRLPDNILQMTIRRIGVRAGNDVLVLDPEKAPPEFVNNHWFASHSTWLAWLNSDPRQEKVAARRLAHVFTERPVYRPEEPVHIKGYIRQRQTGRIIADMTGHTTSLYVTAPGDKKWTFPIQLNAMGSFYQKFAAPDLPSGNYQAEIYDEKDQTSLAAIDFKMESYRIPTFEVKLTGPEETGLDEPFKVTLMANYYAGGRVVGQAIDWKVTQYLYQPNIPGYLGFIFSSDERFSGGRTSTAGGSSNKKDVTDENGSAIIKIDPTTEEDGHARRYMVEATVLGADEMTVTAVKETLALPPFYLGLHVPRMVKSSADLKVQALVLGVDRKPLAGKEFHLRVYRREWHSYLQESDFTTGKAKYVSDVVDKPILDRDMKSAGKPQDLALEVKEAGVYVIEISAHDKSGRLLKVSADFYLAGQQAIAWKKTMANVFECVPDREFYYPGQTAHLALKSPFQNARALVVVEGPAQNTYHWLDVANGQAVFEILIAGDMTPQMPVHFLLLRGRLPVKIETLEAGGEDRGKPLAMGNTTWIKVRPRSNEIRVDLEHPAQCLPAAKIKMKIKLSDPDGKPLNGEVTLWLVDRAVLALGKEKALDPLPSFISQVVSMLRLRNTRNQTVGNISTDEIAGGDTGAEEKESIFDNVTVRKNFKTVPYYNPNIMVSNGAAEVDIDMPDNLTDFAVRAVATNGLERFGAAKSKIAVRLPLIVQPALPRFVRPGDSFAAGGIGRVVEGEGGPGRVEIQTKGLTLGGDAAKTLQWVKDRPEKLYFLLSLPLEKSQFKDEQVTVCLAVLRDSDGAKDAFEVKLPVRNDVRRKQLEVFSRLQKDKDLSFPQPEEAVRPGSLHQQAILTHDMAIVKMLAALDYLSQYEYGCTEQRISKVLPELALKDILKLIGREDRGNVVDHYIRETLIYLEMVLTPSGLYSYWPGSPGYVSLTAYVVEFLVAVQKLGYDFKKDLLDRGLKALKESLRSDYSRFIDGCSYIERAEALNALAMAGQYDKAYAVDLQARSVNMDLYGAAKVLHVFLEHDRNNRKAIDSLVSDLWRSVIFKLRDGKEVYGGLQYRADTYNGLILPSEVKAMAGAAKSLYLFDERNARVKLLIDELVSRGEGDGWGSTNANASALLALAQVFKKPEIKHQGQKIAAIFGDKTEWLDTAGKFLVRVVSTAEASGKLQFREGDSQDLPMAWLRIEYLPAGSGDQQKQNNNGFVVERELLTILGGDKPPVKNNVLSGKILEYAMGTVIEEHIRVINPENRHYVAVAAPFAAGFEPLNPNLETAPAEAKPAGVLTLEPAYAAYEDDKVTFYFDTLPKGTFDFFFRLRANFTGSFSHPPAQAQMMYRLKTSGQSDGTRVVIR